MPILEPAIRPPAEANSFLLQVTSGCSANDCTFCGAYLNKPFQIKSLAEINEDIRLGARYYPETRRVFLMDGDALVLTNNKLIPILEVLNANFPLLNRIASYANGYNITRRSNAELMALYEHKLRLIYLGLESGSQEILDNCTKKSSAEEMITAVQRAQQFNIKGSVMVLLGLGGKKKSAIHVKDSIEALNKMQPRYLSFLTLMLVPGTKLFKEAQQGLFQELTPYEHLQELYDILAGLELKQTIVRANHASNYLNIEGRYPQDKQKILTFLKSGLDKKIGLKPELFRGL